MPDTGRRRTTYPWHDDGFDFLGFHIQRHTQWGTDRRRVYSYPAAKAIASVRAKVKDWTGHGTLHIDPREVFLRLNQILRGWTNYFRHGASEIAFRDLDHYLWYRIWKWLRRRHRRRHWRWIVAAYGQPHNRWGFTADGIDLFRPAAVPIQRYRYRGAKIPTAWSTPTSTASA